MQIRSGTLFNEYLMENVLSIPCRLVELTFVDFTSLFTKFLDGVDFHTYLQLPAEFGAQ